MPHQIALLEFSQNRDFASRGGGVKRIQLSHTFEDVISLENLLEAWREFICGKQHKADVQIFSLHLMDTILALHEDLASKTYVHGGYQDFRICDPKPRHIHKASVRDRLLHHVIYRVIYPFFERTFIADSFSCRDNKGTHKALNRFRAMAYKVSRNHTRTAWVLKCDIRKFFASVDHGTLLKLLESYIPDQDIMWLLNEVIESFCTSADMSSSRMRGSSDPGILDSRFHGNDRLRIGDNNGEVGFPLGNLTSQLFSNIYMNKFDQFVKHRLKARHYIRYADDFVLLSEDDDWLVAQVPKIREFLYHKLHLELHPNKISISTIASGVDFLGWVHFPDHRVLRAATKRRMMRRLHARPINEILQSYIGLLRHGNSWKIQQRIRANYWLRQWSSVCDCMCFCVTI